MCVSSIVIYMLLYIFYIYILGYVLYILYLITCILNAFIIDKYVFLYWTEETVTFWTWNNAQQRIFPSKCIFILLNSNKWLKLCRLVISIGLIFYVSITNTYKGKFLKLRHLGGHFEAKVALERSFFFVNVHGQIIIFICNKNEKHLSAEKKVTASLFQFICTIWTWNISNYWFYPMKTKQIAVKCILIL